MKIVLVTGGFDPLHSGHIAYFKAAQKLGDFLIVGINSDAWLKRKKGRAFMPWHERAEIVRNLGMVYDVVEYDDSDGSSIDAIKKVRSQYPGATITFANGGDRTAENIPEMAYQDANLFFRFEVGGEDKLNSSSWILEEWKAPKTERHWGYYRVLHELQGCKVKELTVEPGQKLSMQRHSDRSEYWLVAEGSCIVNSMTATGYFMPARELHKHQHIHIGTDEWHQLENPFNEPCRIVEIQYGSRCDEDDIERK